MNNNFLYYGDNLTVMREHIKDNSIDLIYLDPPFNSNQNYNVLFSERNGNRSRAQIKAFEDTWTWTEESRYAYEEVVEMGGRSSQVMQAFYEFLGTNNLMAYLSMMAPRLIEMYRVLKDAGSIYLHCDPAASHYLKLLMDAIFDPVNFKNEIIWRRTGSHGTKRSYGPIHDVILFYTKSNEYYFNIQKRPYMMGHVNRRYSIDSNGRYKFSSGGNVLTGAGKRDGESGAEWRGFNPTLKNRHWAIPGFLANQMTSEFKKLGVLDKLEALYQKGLIEIKPNSAWPIPVRFLDPNDGQPYQDIWAYQPYTENTVFGTDHGIDFDVAWLGTTDPERLGYQTQKPLGILERIINCSCPDNGIVLDPFCGCGTAIIASQKLNRNWIGIDITQLAITLIKHRLKDSFGDNIHYDVIGEPVVYSEAEKLAKNDPFQFQWWALSLVGARPIENQQKKGADKGIDGKLYFHDEEHIGKSKKIIFQVKSGHVGVKDVRDLRGVIERDKAEIGIFITLHKPTNPMIIEATEAGMYYSPLWDKKYHRIQIVTIQSLMEGKKINCPPTRGDYSIKKARRIKKSKTAKQDTLARFNN